MTRLIVFAVSILSGLTAANAGTWIALNFPDASNTTHISGISGNDIFGYYGTSNSQHGFIYDGTNWTTIDMPMGVATQVSGISGNYIVGDYLDSSDRLLGRWHGFLYDGTNWTTLPLTGAAGIDGSIIVQANQLYNIDTQSLTTLNFPGASRTNIYNINGSDVVGSYTISDGGWGSNSTTHGFIYNMSTQNWTTFDVDVTGAQTSIYGIDGSNIIGKYTISGNPTSFLYDGTSLILDLPGSDAIGSPSGISGNTIVGTYYTYYENGNLMAFFSHGYVYTIPEPATVLLLGLGATFLLRKKK